MKYTHIAHDFSLEIVPVSVGGFERILRMNHADVGSLFEFLAPLLYQTPGVRAGKFWFTLVNVTCSHTGFSYGLCPPPPKSAVPLSSTWSFTFALKGDGYGEGYMAEHAMRLGMSVTRWGKSFNRGDFLTIGITQTQATAFRIRYDQYATQQLYYLVGALTKSFVLNSRFNTVDSDYSLHYQTMSTGIAYAKWYMMPLYTAVRNVAYHRWVFNRHIWDIGVKLLSPRHVTSFTMVYMCKYIRQVSKMQPELEAAVVDIFHESLTDLIQRRKSMEAPTYIGQVLYCALLNKGNIPETDDFVWLAGREAQLTLPMGSYKSHILGLLYA